MLIEKYLEKILRLRVALYQVEAASGVEANIPSHARGDRPEWFQRLSADKKARVEPLLVEMESLRRSLQGVQGGEQYYSRYVASLSRIYQIGDRGDPEFAQIVESLNRKSQQLETLKQQSTDIATRIEQIQASIGRIVQGLRTESQERGGELETERFAALGISRDAVRTGTKFTIDESKLSTEAKQIFSTFGKLVPSSVMSIKVGDKVYTRSERGGEFLDQERNILDFAGVRGKEVEIATIGKSMEELANIGRSLVESEVQKYLTQDNRFDREKLTEFITDALADVEFLGSIVVSDESSIRTQIQAYVAGEVNQNKDTLYKDTLPGNGEADLERNNARLRGLRELQVSIETDLGITPLKDAIQRLNREKSDITEELTANREHPQKQAKEARIGAIIVEITDKNLEIQNLRTRPVDSLRTLPGIPEGKPTLEGLAELISTLETATQVTIARGRRDIRQRPLTYNDRATQREPVLLRRVLDFILRIFGIQQPSQEQRNNYASVLSGDAASRLGGLSEHFESAGRGPEYINPNDANLGFPSYGTYQMNRATLRGFVARLQTQGITIEGNPEEVGTNTAFANNWRQAIQRVGVERFKQLEHTYVREVYFVAQMNKISGIGIDTSKFSLTMQNVIWSTAVQHGQNTDLITTILQGTDFQGKQWTPELERKAIEAIYAERTRRYPPTANRYRQELAIALTQLEIHRGTLVAGQYPAILSAPAEINPATQVTQCSRTAALNATRFGLSLRTGDARQVETSYGAQVQAFSSSSSGQVADVFSNSSRFPQYGHRAIAFRHDNQWFVLDPYLRIPVSAPRTSRESPIPLADYQNFLTATGRGPMRAAIVRA